MAQINLPGTNTKLSKQDKIYTFVINFAFIIVDIETILFHLTPNDKWASPFPLFPKARLPFARRSVLFMGNNSINLFEMIYSSDSTGTMALP